MKLGACLLDELFNIGADSNSLCHEGCDSRAKDCNSKLNKTQHDMSEGWTLKSNAC